MWTLLISCLIHSGSFFFIPSADPDQCRSFLIKWCIQFRIFPDSDWLCRIFYSPLYWLNFTHFLGYKLKLILRLIKREYQTLISISTILKFQLRSKNFLVISVGMGYTTWRSIHNSTSICVFQYYEY